MADLIVQDVSIVIIIPDNRPSLHPDVGMDGGRGQSVAMAFQIRHRSRPRVVRSAWVS